MIIDLFSGFDEAGAHTWALLGLPMALLIRATYWANTPFQLTWLSIAVKSITNEARIKQVGGLVARLTACASIILVLNLFGITPYSFRLTSHIALNWGLALLFWAGIIASRVSYDLKRFLSHLAPEGAPLPLIIFLVLVEVVSRLIRPITLAIRLTANISAGHILIALLGGARPAVWGLGVLYFLFEFAICGVQAYIFFFLLQLYADEHPAWQSFEDLKSSSVA